LKEDLGMDSIDAVNLAIQLEKIFDIKISDEQLHHISYIILMRWLRRRHHLLDQIDEVAEKKTHQPYYFN
ncbi:MAG: phosphopantetheine-binding protein, partial [Candidatus Phytoplasma australasiaticum]|nr:phosphopantetheine-binding protein [Candidatus Phytoplasma australasiaticum]